VLNVGRRDARSRMSHLLCEFAIRMQAQGLRIPKATICRSPRNNWADALGLTAVRVNRTLNLLEASGLIVRNKRSIPFPSWERMRDVADFNQRYLHLEPSIPRLRPECPSSRDSLRRPRARVTDSQSAEKRTIVMRQSVFLTIISAEFSLGR
jgi:hypothetical protein